MRPGHPDNAAPETSEAIAAADRRDALTTSGPSSRDLPAPNALAPRQRRRGWRNSAMRRHHPAAESPGALQVSALACAAGRRTVVTDVDFTVSPGETVGIVGPNGAGKTTLLRTLAGLITPAAGEVVVDGRPVHQVSARERARLVGLVGQDEVPPTDLLVGELVALGRTPYLPPWGAGGPGERAAVERALRQVDLAGFEARAVGRLSGGERQRVLLARALAQDTPVLLLDEPTNHLDITHQLELLALTRELARTVVMSLHDLTLADRFCDRVLVLDAGRARPLEPPGAALRPEVLAEVFGVLARRVPDPDSGGTHLVITGRKANS
ncbi:ABC transporter ATP-binding protein [Nocardia sp. CA-145437]|uniref:ABC transporter ATP-binding protein n=1 Tax=Nocardia sp. CA-145437 TaxID=3239980 RepID=UPI003D95E80C